MVEFRAPGRKDQRRDANDLAVGGAYSNGSLWGRMVFWLRASRPCPGRPLALKRHIAPAVFALLFHVWWHNFCQSSALRPIENTSGFICHSSSGWLKSRPGETTPAKRLAHRTCKPTEVEADKEADYQMKVNVVPPVERRWPRNQHRRLLQRRPGLGDPTRGSVSVWPLKRDFIRPWFRKSSPA